ncbi:MAG: HEAT repeat domain-containing protein [Bryobacteraceae bacterium]
MLVIVRFSDGSLARFEFGRPVQPETTPEERVRAILADYRRRDELIDVGFTPGVAILISILERAGERPEDILIPIRALGFMGRPYGAEAVGKHIRHPDAAVRLAAIRSLGQMAKFDSIPLVEPYLLSPNVAERREAIIALGKFAKEELLPAVEAAAGADPELQQLARQARARVLATKHGIATKDYGPLVDALIGTDEYEDLLPLLIVTWKPLKALLADRTRSVQHRERALRLLAIGRPKEIIPEMRKILTDPNEPLPIRLRAVYGLGRARSRSSAGLLVERLQSPEPGMPGVCAHALGQIGDPGAFDPLLAVWDSGSGPLRERIRQAAALLSSLPGAGPAGAPQEIFVFTDDLALVRQFRRDQIEAALLSPSAPVRRDGLTLLSLFGSAGDAPILARAAETDPDSINRGIARQGAARLVNPPRGNEP